MPHSSLGDDFLVGGEWLVRPRLNRIEGRGRVRQVQPKIMSVLITLAGSAGQVVTKESLFRTVWADTHVTDHVLARAISELRKAFGDSAREPKVIETIPKTGYRLIAVVSRPSGGGRGKSAAREGRRPPAGPQPNGTTRRHFRLWLGLGVASAAAGLALLALYLLFFVRHVGHWHPGHH